MSTRIGFGVSGLLHAGLAAVLWWQWPELPAAPEETPLSLDLAMFAPAPAPVPEQPVPEDIPEPKPEEPPEPEPEPEPELKPEPPPEPAPAPVPKPKPKPEAKRPKPRKRPPPPPPPAMASASEPQKVEPLPRAQPAAISSARLMDLEQRYKLALLRAIESKRHYPARAQRYRWEGVVRVAFTLLHDGRLVDIRIDESCGHPALDGAALAAVANVGRFEPIPGELNRERWEFVVPLRFELL